jgi:hypothetical protein
MSRIKLKKKKIILAYHAKIQVQKIFSRRNQKISIFIQSCNKNLNEIQKGLKLSVQTNV